MAQLLINITVVTQEKLPNVFTKVSFSDCENMTRINKSKVVNYKLSVNAIKICTKNPNQLQV